MPWTSSGGCREPSPVPEHSGPVPAAAAADLLHPRAAIESSVHKPVPQNSVFWFSLIFPTFYNIIEKSINEWVFLKRDISIIKFKAAVHSFPLCVCTFCHYQLFWPNCPTRANREKCWSLPPQLQKISSSSDHCHLPKNHLINMFHL